MLDKSKGTLLSQKELVDVSESVVKAQKARAAIEMGGVGAALGIAGAGVGYHAGIPKGYRSAIGEKKDALLKSYLLEKEAMVTPGDLSDLSTKAKVGILLGLGALGVGGGLLGHRAGKKRGHSIAVAEKKNALLQGYLLKKEAMSTAAKVGLGIGGAAAGATGLSVYLGARAGAKDALTLVKGMENPMGENRPSMERTLSGLSALPAGVAAGVTLPLGAAFIPAMWGALLPPAIAYRTAYSRSKLKALEKLQEGKSRGDKAKKEALLREYLLEKEAEGEEGFISKARRGAAEAFRRNPVKKSLLVGLGLPALLGLTLLSNRNSAAARERAAEMGYKFPEPTFLSEKGI